MTSLPERLSGAKYRLLSPVPGLVVFSLLYAATLRGFDWMPWVEYLYGALWQGLGRHLLETDPLGSLSVLHIQPPGLMSIKALDLVATPDSHEFLRLSFFAFGALSVILIVDGLHVSGPKSRWASSVGVVYALLPGTVLYTLFPFSTAPTIFGCSLAIWGVAVAKRSLIVGAWSSACGVFFLYVFRTSFTWVFVLLWLLSLVWLVFHLSQLKRERVAALSGVALFGVLVVGIQIHYLTSFGLWTTTSWSGENVTKALAESGHLKVSSKAIRAADRISDCAGSLARDLAGGNAPSWLPEHVLALSGCGDLKEESTSGIEALDSPFKDGAYDGRRVGNFNWSQRLAISTLYSQVAVEILKAEPRQLISMAIVGGPSGSRASGLSLYVAPSDDYGWVTGIREGYPNKTIGGLLSLLFAPFALTVAIIGSIFAILGRENGRVRGNSAFWFSLGLVGYHMAVSILGEYGENNRFQAEVAPALMFLTGISLWAMLSGDPSPMKKAVNRQDSVIDYE